MGRMKTILTLRLMRDCYHRVDKDNADEKMEVRLSL